jgi:hypothetical protein
MAWRGVEQAVDQRGAHHRGAARATIRAMNPSGTSPGVSSVYRSPQPPPFGRVVPQVAQRELGVARAGRPAACRRPQRRRPVRRRPSGSALDRRTRNGKSLFAVPPTTSVRFGVADPQLARGDVPD